MAPDSSIREVDAHALVDDVERGFTRPVRVPFPAAVIVHAADFRRHVSDERNGVEGPGVADEPALDELLGDQQRTDGVYLVHVHHLVGGHVLELPLAVSVGAGGARVIDDDIDGSAVRLDGLQGAEALRPTRDRGLVGDVQGDHREARLANLLLERGKVIRGVWVATRRDDGVTRGLGEDLLAKFEADAAVGTGDDDAGVRDRLAGDVLFIHILRGGRGNGHVKAPPRGGGVFAPERSLRRG